MESYHVALKALAKVVQCIPLNEFKTPAVPFKNIEITQDFIESHFKEYRSTSVLGVLTRGLWCIDIDVGHADGQDGFKSIEAIPFNDELEKNAENTLIQVTPSGGMHIIFKKREGIEYRQKIGYLPGVDIKAHDNNYFVMGGSVTKKGVYQHNGKKPIEYEGEFESRIFSERGSFKEQIMAKYSVKKALPNYDFSHLRHTGKGGRGKEAYERIISGQSIDRNNDLYRAATYVKQCNVDLNPLRILIGDVKNGDEITESEWQATVDSAQG